ncbi:poly(3-hydroxyalkanoate) depolymerase [Caballeronia sp. RCC_10]|uniref:poly(3-hydroxyalkanoate) depolymerase n=1 Tax=Caballeronia sp. RCC_10 TaxID=3239227 RepID=UPI003526340B
MQHPLESARTLEIQAIDLEGQTLRVGIRHGSSDHPPLVIFNGIGANLELLAPFIDELQDVSVIIFDVPGVGGSPAPQLPYRFSTLATLTDKLLSRLGFDGPVDALGVSWGGALAQQFAQMHPVRCRRLVLAATSPGVIMVPSKLSVFAQLMVPRRYSDPAYLAEIGGDIYGGAYRRNPELLEEHRRHIQAPKGHGYFYQLLAMWGWSSLPWLRTLPQTTLVIHGDDDPIVPLINAEILAARIRHATLHVIDDGHLFLVSRAKEVAVTVHSFLCGDLVEPEIQMEDRSLEYEAQ